MIDFKVNENGDWQLDQIVKGNDASTQRVLQRLRLILTEAFWAEDEGMRFFNFVGKDTLSDSEIDLLKSNIKQELTRIKEVDGIYNIQISTENKNIKTSLEVEINKELIPITI